MKLLIVEDDVDLLKMLRRGLQSTYYVDSAVTGSAGLHEATSNDYDGIVLDLGLPGLSGIEVCRRLRAAGVSTPVLILTAESDTGRKVELLDVGADDYLTKPFSMSELHARIRALLRRQLGTTRKSCLQVHDLLLDTATREVKRAGTPIQLRRKEFEILEYMMHHVGMTLTRDMILNHAWDRHDELWGNAVDVHIKHLRDKIDRPFGVSLIQTVYGLGYKLEASDVVAATSTEKGGDKHEANITRISD
jgi:two-component system OmpR family response regulator